MERGRVLTKLQVKQLPYAREGLELLEAQLDGEEINASSGEESAALPTIGAPGSRQKRKGRPSPGSAFGSGAIERAASPEAEGMQAAVTAADRAAAADARAAGLDPGAGLGGGFVPERVPGRRADGADLPAGAEAPPGRCAGLPGAFWRVHLHLPLLTSEPALDSRIGCPGSVSPLSRSTLAETRQQALAEERSQDFFRA